MSRAFRAAALVVTDRRWAAPLSAMALGFGLFIGVAIGPAASGTLATGGYPRVIEIPSFGGDADEGGEDATSQGSAGVPAPLPDPSLPSYDPAPLAPAAVEPLPAGEPQSPFRPTIGLGQAAPVFEPRMAIGEASAVPAESAPAAVPPTPSPFPVYETGDFPGENHVNEGASG